MQWKSPPSLSDLCCRTTPIHTTLFWRSHYSFTASSSIHTGAPPELCWEHIAEVLHFRAKKHVLSQTDIFKKKTHIWSLNCSVHGWKIYILSRTTSLILLQPYQQGEKLQAIRKDGTSSAYSKSILLSVSNAGC